MNEWREEILKYFAEPVPSLTIMADPDGMLLDAKILQALSEQAIEVIEYSEAVSFRFLYESRYRDALEQASLHLVVRIEETSCEALPFDILSMGRKVNISLGNLFPALSVNVLKQLAKGDLDAIAKAYSLYAGTNNETETANFVLEKVFNIHMDNVNNAVDLMKFLITLHNSGQQIPDILALFLSDKWGQEPQLKKLPLKELLCSEQFFFHYLQAEWNDLIEELKQKPLFLKETLAHRVNTEEKYLLADRSIRLLMDNLFAEGKLHPVTLNGLNRLPEWVNFGIEVNADEQIRVRLIDRILYLSKKLDENMTYKDWIHTAIVFGEIKEKALVLKDGQDHEVNIDLAQLQMQIDRLFSKWTLDHYNHLSNLPYLPDPVMVHHIPHFLANKSQANKIALVILDGMSLVQWIQIREALKVKYDFEQQGVFAWIPTITSVSRQAIFCGERPVYYSTSINSTAKEERHWQLFWENHGLLKQYVDYCRIANYPSAYQVVGAVNPNNKVRAIVIDLIDQLVHAAIQGNRGLYEELKIWLETGFLSEMISSLLNEGYQVYLTSDHGNRECVGSGKISEGVLAHTRGERVRAYSTKNLRDQAVASYGGIPWDSPALPVNTYTLLAPVDGAFIAPGEKIVSHGGMSLEEVIVPFVKILPKEMKVDQ